MFRKINPLVISLVKRCFHQIFKVWEEISRISTLCTHYENLLSQFFTKKFRESSVVTKGVWRVYSMKYNEINSWMQDPRCKHEYLDR